MSKIVHAQKISFKGCKGNDNRFATVESCFNTCGGQEPETISTCKGITCDHSMANMMKAKGCQPLIQPGNITLEYIDPCTMASLLLSHPIKKRKIGLE